MTEAQFTNDEKQELRKSAIQSRNELLVYSENAHYQLSYYVLLISSAVLPLLISLSQVSFCNNFRTLFYYGTVLLLSGSILTNLTFLYGRVDYYKRILDKRQQQIALPGSNMKVDSTNQKGVAFVSEENPVSLERKFFCPFQEISLILFALSILSLAAYSFLK